MMGIEEKILEYRCYTRHVVARCSHSAVILSSVWFIYCGTISTRRNIEASRPTLEHIGPWKSHDLIELQQCTHISSNPEPCLNRMGHTCWVRINIACRLLNPNVI